MRPVGLRRSKHCGLRRAGAARSRSRSPWSHTRETAPPWPAAVRPRPRAAPWPPGCLRSSGRISSARPRLAAAAGRLPGLPFGRSRHVHWNGSRDFGSETLRPSLQGVRTDFSASIAFRARFCYDIDGLGENRHKTAMMATTLGGLVMRHRPVSAILLSFLSAAVLGFPAASARAADPPAATASASVVDLSCEYLQDPLGIDAREPRLSCAWRPATRRPAACVRRPTRSWSAAAPSGSRRTKAIFGTPAK